MALEVRGGDVIVRAPNRYPQKKIDEFVAAHDAWLKDKLAKSAAQSKTAEQMGFLSEGDLKLLAEKARAYIPQRAAIFAKEIGVTYGTITIRCQRTKWGSCSGKGNLNFNCLLMLTPPEVIDCVVAHELCHRKEMNHSARFYAEVRRAFPEYDKWQKWLKDNGGAILRRMK